MEYGINGTATHASLLTQEQKNCWCSAIVNDVVGTHYVTYRYLAPPPTTISNQPHMISAMAHYGNGLRRTTSLRWIQASSTSRLARRFWWKSIKPVTAGYEFIGTDRSISLATQNYSDHSLWVPVVIDVETQATLRLEGEDPSTVKTVVLNQGNLVAERPRSNV